MARAFGIYDLPGSMGPFSTHSFWLIDKSGVIRFRQVSLEMHVPFDQVGRLSSHEVYAHAKAAFRRHTRVDGLYMLGSGWRVMDILELLEQDLDVPVVHPIPARVWAIQQLLLVRQRTSGFGRLLAELPLPAN